MRVLVTGAAGFIGFHASRKLLLRGDEVVGFDNLNYYYDVRLKEARLARLAANAGFRFVRGDLKDLTPLSRLFQAGRFDAVINLACISNDASFELDEKLSTTINLDAFEPMVIAAKKAGVKRFIYASSSSVYGVSESPDVTEDHPLVPLTLYNKYKGMCEPLLFKHQSKDFVCTVIRPATLCGYAPRQRLDLSVNILTNHAINAGKITVFGGSQKRPNLHVQDMCDVYKLVLTVDDAKIAGQIFNAGFQNLSIMEIAHLAKKVVQQEFPDKGDIPIVTTPTDDIRSYHVNSDKITRVLGFKPKHSVEDAIRDLCKAFKAGKLPNSMQDTFYFNVRRLKELKAA